MQEPQRTAALRQQAADRLGVASRRDIAALPLVDVQEMVYELQLHQIELEMQNEELRRVRLELEASRDLYLELYDFAPVGYLTLSPQGIIRAANLSVAAMLGVERSLLLHMRLQQFLVQSDRGVLRRHLAEVLAAKEKRSCEIGIGPPGGDARVARLDTVAVAAGAADGADCFVAVIDVTDRRRAEHRLQETQHLLRTLGRELSRTEDRERRRLAEILHGNVSQMLYAIRTRLALLDWHRGEAALQSSLAEVDTLLDEAHCDVQRLSFDLCPPILYEAGLASALIWLAEEFRKQHGVECEVVPPRKPLILIDDIAIVLYRATRELLANVARHSRASRVRIEVASSGRRVEVSVADDGVGMDVRHVSPVGRAPAGFGLFSIHERVGSLGGFVEVDSSPGQGVRVRMCIPTDCPGPLTAGRDEAGRCPGENRRARSGNAAASPRKNGLADRLHPQSDP